MACNTVFLLWLFILIAIAVALKIISSLNILDVISLNRSSFPEDFVFGTATSAYQYEGAIKEGGRGMSIWDNFTHKYPEKIFDRSNGDVAVDGYHRYKEDVEIMKYMNLDAFRLSISWTRILPNGRISGGINQEGITYYNNFINELIANGIEVFVTLFHWDLPQALEDEYGGFLSPRIVSDFRDYAELCFKEFGDRVKYWITLNEPPTYVTGGYVIGTFSPGRCSDWQNLNCTGGDSGTEPYLVGHHLLLAHAAAVEVYKTKYQVPLLLKSQSTVQKGLIGIAIQSYWFVPFSNSKSDEKAAERALDFLLGWFMEPLTTGNYPQHMRSLIGRRLPMFSKEQSRILNGSFDFIGLNYYTSRYAANAPLLNNTLPCYLTDFLANITTERNGIPIGPKGASDWFCSYPKGFKKLLLYMKEKYNNPLIYVTENGIDEKNDPTLSLDEALKDTHRIKYYYDHLSHLRSAIRNGVNVKGYFAWSLLDNFEWTEGYTVRFGSIFVDYNNNLKRYRKQSAEWFKNFLRRI
ncbi:beta-glucosidase 13-like [Cicer arietinum]|uniref:Beta-glucosidase 12-like n=1 Tax=Cicer arietinum TaxID=3827 RepID=A0A1S2XKB1_CICAR|nr:beta-glucosidase 12-like [Cicer arietinum]